MLRLRLSTIDTRAECSRSARTCSEAARPAEDALQLTFVSAFRVLRAASSGVSLRPWRTRSLAIAASRSCASRRGGVDVDRVAADRPFFEGVADEVQRREELRETLEDMQRLPADQRAALVLFELGDHSHKEIAAVLGVRTEKVKALIFRRARRSCVAGTRGIARARSPRTTGNITRQILPRSVTRAHIDRCPSCAAFEAEVRRQRRRARAHSAGGARCRAQGLGAGLLLSSSAVAAVALARRRRAAAAGVGGVGGAGAARPVARPAQVPRAAPARSSPVARPPQVGRAAPVRRRRWRGRR